MWSLTSTDTQLAKEELKGRRAAMEARYAKDIRELDADLAEIETLERAAIALTLKHKIEDVGIATIAGTEPDAEREPEPETPSTIAPSADSVDQPGDAPRWR